MQLLVIVFNKVEFLSDFLSVMIEAGIAKATMLESEGLGHHLAYKVPIFAGLRVLEGNVSANSKTILSIIDNDAPLIKLKELLAETDMDFSKPGTGIMFTIPITEVIKT